MTYNFRQSVGKVSGQDHTKGYTTAGVIPLWRSFFVQLEKAVTHVAAQPHSAHKEVQEEWNDIEWSGKRSAW
jgi:hypothetical protein